MCAMAYELDPLMVVVLVLLLPEKDSKVPSHRHAQSENFPPNQLRLGIPPVRPLLGPTPIAPAPGSLQDAANPTLKSSLRHAVPIEPAAGYTTCIHVG